MQRRCWLIILSLFMPLPAQATTTDPLFYSQTEIRIIRYSSTPLPWQDPASRMNDTGVTFRTEVRDGSAFYNQKGWISLVSPLPYHAILLFFGAPVLAPIVQSQQYASLDIVMLNKEGMITQILPDLRLSDVAEDIYPAAPITAFLLLRGGTCKALSIAPGDSVEYALFKKPPPIITAPNIPSKE